MPIIAIYLRLPVNGIHMREGHSAPLLVIATVFY